MVVFILGLIVSAIAAYVYYEYDDSCPPGLYCFILFLSGGFVSYLVGLVMSAFGQLVEDVHNISNGGLIKGTDSNIQNTAHSTHVEAQGMDFNDLPDL